MTAEIAILNRSAVALAADSAMTFGRPGSEKIYPANKVFTLSKFHPVGIMIYNNADHMSVPLETIIKMHRESEWDSSEPTVQRYAEKFASYLLNPKFCTKEQVSKNVARIFHSAFSIVNSDAHNEIEKIVEKTGKVPIRGISKILSTSIGRERRKLLALDDSASLSNLSKTTIVSRHETEFKWALEAAFDPLPITNANKSALRVLARLAIVKDRITDSHTGIVVTGFGEDEMFPSLIEFLVDGVVDGALKYRVGRQADISRDQNDVNICAFAQGEMVLRFMNGVDPSFELYIKSYVQQLIKKLTNEIINSHASGSTRAKQTIKKGVAETIKDYMDRLDDYSNKVKYDVFARDIIEVVRHMPKPELAHMAEALVNLTSIKRRVSAEKETVGGPVDVAVISKGDGFVWVKRKHYFNKDLNQDFMMRYFNKG